MSPTLYTVGHSRRSSEELLQLLKYVGIRQVIDIRAYPHSARHPWFNDAALRSLLEAAGIRYRWLGRELGGRREQQPNSPHVALAQGGLRAFADHMETRDFARGVYSLVEAAAGAPTAMMCAEVSPAQCHRALVADFLVASDVQVVHVIGVGETQVHTLHPAARKEDGRLIYERTSQHTLELD